MSNLEVQEEEKKQAQLKEFSEYFILKNVSNIQYITVNGDISKRMADLFNFAIFTIKIESQKLNIIDYRTVKNMTPIFFRMLIKYQSNLHLEGKKLVNINISPHLGNFLRKHGVFQALNIVDDISKLNGGSSRSVVMNKVLDKMNITMKEALKSYFDNTDLFKDINGSNSVKLNDLSFEEFDYIAILPFDTGNFGGDIRFIATKNTMISIYNHMMKKEVKRLNPMVIDYMKEFLNILFGNIKANVGDKLGSKINMGIPIICHWKEIRPYVNLRPYKSSIIYSFKIGKEETSLNLNILDLKSSK